MSNSLDKTKLGAGDGLRTPTITRTNKLNRTAVPSSRRFTPRTPSRDNERSSERTKQKLQEAIESILQQGETAQLTRTHGNENQHERTPIPMRCKRAQTVAEIMPSKKGGLFGITKDQGLTMTKKASAGTLGTIADSVSNSMSIVERHDEHEDGHRERKEAAVATAARRVYSQLLLNAWRHRRRDASLLTDSSMQLQHQVQQLQLQVDVLQQLRQSEGRRRSEAAQDNCQLKIDLQKCEQKRQELAQEKDDLVRKQEEIESKWTCTKMELAIEQDTVKRISQDLLNEKRSVANSIEDINELRNDRELLGKKVQSQEDMLGRENRKIKNLSCDIVNLENSIHGEMIRNKKYVIDLDTIENILKVEREQTIKLKQELIAMEQYQLKNTQKMSELKKRITVISDIKGRILRDNCNLKRTVAEMQILLQKEIEKPWWRTSGQLMYTFLHNASYLLLPNLPNNNFYDRKRIIDGNTKPEVLSLVKNK